MIVTAKILIAIIAVEHLIILWVEMFGWESVGKKVFTSLPPDLFTPTKMLAANQGLYNGFLSAGLIWSLFISDAIWQNNIALFFLGCVIVAGIYGAITSAKKIFFVQALPAIVAFAAVLLSR